MTLAYGVLAGGGVCARVDGARDRPPARWTRCSTGVRRSTPSWRAARLSGPVARERAGEGQPARGGPGSACRSRWPTTWTSTPRFTTPRTWAGCSGPTPSRCCPTGATCRSATTGAPGRWCRAARRCGDRAGSGARAGFGPSAAARHRARGRLRDRGRRAAGRAGARGAALDHVFGMVLVNDWSARDIQAWEYQPLGRSSASRSPPRCRAGSCRWPSWRDRRVPAEPQEPEPLHYLREEPWAYDIAAGGRAERRTWWRGRSTRHLYWSIAQQVAHLTVERGEPAGRRPARDGARSRGPSASSAAA